MEYIEVIRMVDRLVITGFGGLCLFFGYQLLRSGIVDVVSAEWEAFGMRLKLTRASPGVFFSALGSFILLYSLNQPVSTETVQVPELDSASRSSGDAPTMTRTSFLGAVNTREWDLMIANLNEAILLLKNDERVGDPQQLQRLREVVLRVAFGGAEYDFYTAHLEAGIDKLDGEQRSKWFALDRRAKKLPEELGIE